MHLITMAHLGEAQGVIEKFHLKRTTQNLFQSEEMVLLLTGEGPFEAATATALTLGQHKISEVINLGIAGTLDPGLKLGEIYPVRTLYLIQDSKPAFKSFTGMGKGLDCLTSFERILNPDKAQPLRGMGSLVDREAWGVAFAAKAGGVPFRSFKLISDVAGSLGACEAIKGEAEIFSLKLALHLESLLGETKSQKEETVLSGFYFTFTTQHKFQTLLNKLSIKHELSLTETLTRLPLEHLRELKALPKERAKLLLEYMEHELDPVKKKLHEIREEWIKTFTKNGISVFTDPEWENPKVTLSLEVSNDEELKQKLLALNSLSLNPYQELMEGKIHVE